MRRRDFLLFRPEQATRVAELSCERLFMHYQRASAPPARRRQEALPAIAWELMDGDPPAEFTEGTVEQLLADVARELQGADAIRVLDTEWLTVEPFRRDVEALVAAVRDRGGRVEYQGSSVGNRR